MKLEETVLREIAVQYDTPSYVFQLDMLMERLQMIREVLGGRARLCYAMKANPFLVEPMNRMEGLVDCFEVCSPGEFHICESAEVPMQRIVLSGVNKEKEDIAYVMRTYGNAGIYTIESRLHLQILEECASAHSEEACIHALVRVTSGNQFGVDEEALFQIIREREQYPHIQIEGLQCYSGTQKKKISKIEKELRWLDGLCIRLEEEEDFTVRHLEYGPGFYVPYFESEEELEDQKLLADFAQLLDGLNFRGDITLEMGRYMAAYCGFYLTKIVDQKRNDGQNYGIIDGGINHLNYFGQMMAMKHPHIRHLPMQNIGKSQVEEQCDLELWNMCGSLCTANDVIVKQFPLVNAQVRDVLVFERVGAYSVTEGIYLFLSRRLPKILYHTEAYGVEIVRDERESYSWNCRFNGSKKKEKV